MWTNAGTGRKVLQCTKTFSFYHDLIEPYWAGGPDELKSGSLHRLCTLSRKMGVQSVLVEDALAHHGIAAEIASLERVHGNGNGAVTAVKLTFIAKRFQSVEALKPEDIIGQAVLVTYPKGTQRKSFIFEAIIRIPRTLSRPSQPLLNNFIPLRRRFRIEVDGRTLDIDASFFCEQNGSTTVCAHSVVKCLLRDLKDARTDAADLNHLWGLAQPAQGATTQQIRQAFEAAGYKVIPYDFTNGPGGKRDDATAWQLMCSQIESGNPALITFKVAGARSHVVPVIGYTLNTDEWHPNATALYLAADQGPVSSSLWIDHLIIHDDMLGPYFCLSRAWLGDGGRDAQREMTPQHMLAILPAAVDISATLAETIASEVLDGLVQELAEASLGRGRWWQILVNGERRRVLRTTLVKKDAYLAHLNDSSVSKSPLLDVTSIPILEESLPDMFWMCELTFPQLYVGNRAKLGEILVRVSPYATNRNDNILGFRFPSLFCLFQGKELQVFLTRRTGHVPLLSSVNHDNRW